MNNLISKDWIKSTEEIENAIWARHDAFEKRFCKNCELISVWLSYSHIKVIFMLYEGQHVTDSFPIKDLINFLEENP